MGLVRRYMEGTGALRRSRRGFEWSVLVRQDKAVRERRRFLVWRVFLQTPTQQGTQFPHLRRSHYGKSIWYFGSD